MLKQIEQNAKAEQDPATKEKIVATLTESFAAVRKTMAGMRSAGSLTREVDFFGTPAPIGGVLTEIDVKAPLRKKLDVDFRKYVILGACNPSLAYQGFQAEPDIGLLLPCNVIVYEQEPTRCRVAILDPVVQLSITERNDIEPLARQAKQRLERALAAI